MTLGREGEAGAAAPAAADSAAEPAAAGGAAALATAAVAGAEAAATPAAPPPPPSTDAELPSPAAFPRFELLEGVDPTDHVYYADSVANPPRRWSRAVAKEWEALRAGLPDTIWAVGYESRTDLLRAAVRGADGTPYHDQARGIGERGLEGGMWMEGGGCKGGRPFILRQPSARPTHPPTPPIS